MRNEFKQKHASSTVGKNYKACLNKVDEYKPDAQSLTSDIEAVYTL